jgi:thioredoxin 1
MKPFTVAVLEPPRKALFFFWHAGWLYRRTKLKTNMSRPLTKEEFKKEVINNSRLALVHFKTDWSGACQIIAPVFEELSKSYTGQVSFYTLDIEKETGIDNEYGVMELPTILFFSKGEIIDHVTGLIPKNVMIKKIENALTSSLN